MTWKLYKMIHLGTQHMDCIINAVNCSINVLWCKENVHASLPASSFPLAPAHMQCKMGVENPYETRRDETTLENG